MWRLSGTVVKGPANSLQPVADSYFGPTIRLRTHQKVRIRFTNRLPESSIVHWHGLDVPESADGHPRLAIDAGKQYVYDFEVTNRAGLYWYHPHPHMRTLAQVYQGLAGLLIVSDAEEDALALPRRGLQGAQSALHKRRIRFTSTGASSGCSADLVAARTTRCERASSTRAGVTSLGSRRGLKCEDWRRDRDSNPRYP
jgi:FtsP/CotA-like multicopper oxidase with cupredoxin domain